MSTMKKAMAVVVAVLAFLMAIFITLYPVISAWYNEQHQAEVQVQYREEVDKNDDSEIRKAKALAVAYNASIVPGVLMMESFSQEALLWASEDYAQQLNLTGRGIMGYIEIPSIDVYLPIYHGTSESTLQMGIGHLLGSSLPVGGNSTHTILTGHSGLASQKMFTDLPQLVEGDVFFLHVLNETLAYQVYFKDEVLPHDTSLLEIREGEDLCTLVTCTPIGINTHRLLVMAERVPYEEAVKTEDDPNRQDQHVVSNWEQEYIRGIMIGAGAAVTIGILTLIVWLIRKRSHRHEIIA